MDYEKKLYQRLKKLINSIDSEKAVFDYEIHLSKKLLVLYENKDKQNFNVFLDVLRDFDIKMNKDTPETQIRRTKEENALKKLIFANTLYHKFNFTNREISETLNCSRASVKYYLENNEIKKKYNAVRYKILLNELNDIISKYDFD